MRIRLPHSCIPALFAAGVLTVPPAAMAQTMEGMDHSAHAPSDQPPMQEEPHMQHRMPMPDEPHMDGHRMSGVLGDYPMTRDASGTAWQPDTSEHQGLHAMNGQWMLMGHALINGVYDWQAGARGDEKAFVSGMLMGTARRSFDNGDTLQLRGMLSPDPFMGKEGYPLLLATGETADGTTPLVDRQHPHELLMELSATYAKQLSQTDSVFIYGGLPGEPAFGPPAFMHRLSTMDSPEAPISHHWLDSTHITFGVVTAGYVRDKWKVEVSRFRGREPDENRYDIETGSLDSTAVRLSWNPTDRLSLQASWADVTSPEQLNPTEDVAKYSTSAIYTTPVGNDGWWSTTAAWGRRTSDHHDLDAFALESAIKPNGRWTVFARAEQTENNELVPGAGGQGPTYRVSKASAGAIRDFRTGEHTTLGVGALYARNFVPSALRPAYGDLDGGMAFIRLKVE